VPANDAAPRCRAKAGRRKALPATSGVPVTSPSTCNAANPTATRRWVRAADSGAGKRGGVKARPPGWLPRDPNSQSVPSLVRLVRRVPTPLHPTHNAEIVRNRVSQVYPPVRSGRREQINQEAIWPIERPRGQR
jgi:hypothetical protein